MSAHDYASQTIGFTCTNRIFRAGLTLPEWIKEFFNQIYGPDFQHDAELTEVSREGFITIAGSAAEGWSIGGK